MYSIQDAVDKSDRFTDGISLGNLQGLVDGHLGWCLVAVLHFIDGNAENVSVNQRHPLHPPIVRMFRQKRIDLVKMATDAMDQFFSIRQSLFADIKEAAEYFDVLFHCFRSARAPLKIVAEQKLQGKFP